MILMLSCYEFYWAAPNIRDSCIWNLHIFVWCFQVKLNEWKANLQLNSKVKQIFRKLINYFIILRANFVFSESMWLQPTTAFQHATHLQGKHASYFRLKLGVCILTDHVLHVLNWNVCLTMKRFCCIPGST